MALRAQGLSAHPTAAAASPAMLRRLGAVQLDTISVLARSHELVAYARLGPIGRAAVETAYWGGPPAGRFRVLVARGMRAASRGVAVVRFPSPGATARAGSRWHEVPEQVCAEVLARLRAEGPLTATDLGGAKRGGPWWDWSEVKIAVEWLLDIGEVVCIERRGWRRVYDLPERALPADVLDADPDDDECLTRLVEQAGRALGVADIGDLAEYHRLHASRSRGGADTALVPVRVRGWRTPPWAHPMLLDTWAAEAGTVPRCSRRSTRWCGIAAALSGYSASATLWRLMSRANGSPAPSGGSFWVERAERSEKRIERFRVHRAVGADAQSRVRLAAPDRLDAELDRGAAGRAGGRERDRRALGAEAVGDAVGDRAEEEQVVPFLEAAARGGLQEVAIGDVAVLARRFRERLRCGHSISTGGTAMKRAPGKSPGRPTPDSGDGLLGRQHGKRSDRTARKTARRG